MKQNIIDQAQFEVKAGNGGNGSVSFLRNKQTRKGGPDGGDGGRGGSIWFEADTNLNTLRFFAGKDRFRAQNGGRGESKKRHGENAEDFTIKVPVGTLIKEKILRFSGSSQLTRSTQDDSPALNSLAGESKNEEGWLEVVDLRLHGQRVEIVKGGKGGRGNKAFASSSNTTPKEAEMGERGERKVLKLELKVLADVGLVGLPNVGKSTLLSILTKARPEIADYPFTTLSPNLGVMEVPDSKFQQIVIADIPGLIEDASQGKGLGIDFLKHIERCKVLVHVLAPNLENQNKAQTIYQDYEAVRKELGKYNADLLAKKEVVVINKADLLQGTGDELRDYFEKNGIKVLLISAVTHEGLENLRQEIQRMLVKG